jgi:hypothetical protein
MSSSFYPEARVSSTAAASSLVSCRFSGLHREKLRRRFRFCATINAVVSLVIAASNFVSPSMALEDRVLPPL